MKKITYYIMILLLSNIVLSTNLHAVNENQQLSIYHSKEVPVEVKLQLERLEVIKNMNKSNLNFSEKKALRKEVRTIKKSLKSSGNGVYLSVGAIIIIILLLILLL